MDIVNVVWGMGGVHTIIVFTLRSVVVVVFLF